MLSDFVAVDILRDSCHVLESSQSSDLVDGC